MNSQKRVNVFVKTFLSFFFLSYNEGKAKQMKTSKVFGILFVVLAFGFFALGLGLFVKGAIDPKFNSEFEIWPLSATLSLLLGVCLAAPGMSFCLSKEQWE